MCPDVDRVRRPELVYFAKGCKLYKEEIVSKDKGTLGVVLHRYRREGLYRREILVA